MKVNEINKIVNGIYDAINSKFGAFADPEIGVSQACVDIKPEGVYIDTCGNECLASALESAGCTTDGMAPWVYNGYSLEENTYWVPYEVLFA